MQQQQQQQQQQRRGGGGAGPGLQQMQGTISSRSMQRLPSGGFGILNHGPVQGPDGGGGGDSATLMQLDSASLSLPLLGQHGSQHGLSGQLPRTSAAGGGLYGSTHLGGGGDDATAAAMAAAAGGGGGGGGGGLPVLGSEASSATSLFTPTGAQLSAGLNSQQQFLASMGIFVGPGDGGAGGGGGGMRQLPFGAPPQLQQHLAQLQQLQQAHAQAQLQAAQHQHQHLQGAAGGGGGGGGGQQQQQRLAPPLSPSGMRRDGTASGVPNFHSQQLQHPQHQSHQHYAFAQSAGGGPAGAGGPSVSGSGTAATAATDYSMHGMGSSSLLELTEDGEQSGASRVATCQGRSGRR